MVPISSREPLLRSVLHFTNKQLNEISANSVNSTRSNSWVRQLLATPLSLDKLNRTPGCCQLTLADFGGLNSAPAAAEDRATCSLWEGGVTARPLSHGGCVAAGSSGLGGVTSSGGGGGGNS